MAVIAVATALLPLLSMGFVLPQMPRSTRSSTNYATSVRLCSPEQPESVKIDAPADEPRTGLRAYDDAEEKALRKTRLGFGGYPAGPYFAIAQTDTAAAYAQVRKDHKALVEWTDDEIKATFMSLKPTPAELLIYSPFGPFIVLSAISIWRDGLSAWNIPPCASYLDVCKAIPTFDSLFGS